MDVKDHWPEIRTFFRGQRAYSIASVNEDGSPHVSPIGSLFLRGDGTGFFLERFTSALPANLDRDPRVCVMVTNMSPVFWVRSLARGTFRDHPGLRLMGVAGERRLATDEEAARFRRKVHSARFLRGHKLLWRDFKYARDIRFERVEPIRLGKMTAELLS